MKVVINSCYGGFGLSSKATVRLHQMGGHVELISLDEWYSCGEKIYAPLVNVETGKRTEYKSLKEMKKDLQPGVLYAYYLGDTPIKDGNVYNYDDHNYAHRSCPKLVKVVEDMGEEANGGCAELSIVEIPDDVSFCINEYDGIETIHEEHRSWS